MVSGTGNQGRVAWSGTPPRPNAKQPMARVPPVFFIPSHLAHRPAQKFLLVGQEGDEDLRRRLHLLQNLNVGEGRFMLSGGYSYAQHDR